MNKPLLGPFEELVLLSTLRLGNRAYGMQIRRDLEEQVRRDVTIGAVYAALERLEAKGYASSEVQRDGSGGRGRRFFEVAPGGIEALDQARLVRSLGWEGVDLDAHLDAKGS